MQDEMSKSGSWTNEFGTRGTVGKMGKYSSGCRGGYSKEYLIDGGERFGEWKLRDLSRRTTREMIGGRRDGLA
jgi:hypothetical protein